MLFRLPAPHERNTLITLSRGNKIGLYTTLALVGVAIALVVFI